MRLTLRTLLAYLDDILEPTQTKEIGQKITESSFASTLINRIREVMRRRRLTAPAVSGPEAGLDPNTVSEYLDNTLPAEKVADVEKICLESDVHLAEVAACHQILTLVLGEPVEISHESRERMYALGPVSEKDQRVASSPTQKTSTSSSRTTTATIASTGGLAAASTASNDSFSPKIPEYLKPRPLWRRALPYLLVLLIGGVWFFLYSIDSPLFLPKEKAQKVSLVEETTNTGQKASSDSNGRQKTSPTSEEQKSKAKSSPASDEVPPQTEPPVTSQENVAVKQPESPVPLDPLPPADLPETETAEAPSSPPMPQTKNNENKKKAPTSLPSKPKVVDSENTETPTEGSSPSPSKVAKNDGMPPQPPKEGGNQPAEAKQPEAQQFPEIQYVSPTGILLRHDEKQQDWFVLPPRSLVHDDERIASPEPYQADLTVGETQAELTLAGGTSVRFLSQTPAGRYGLHIERGRVVLECGSEKQADDQGVLAIAAGEDLWRLELMTEETRCGIEITPRRPNQLDQEFGSNSYTGKLLVTKGSVRLADGAGQVQLIDAGTWVPLGPESMASVEKQERWVAPKLSVVPEWLDPKGNNLTSIQRRYAVLFKKEFLMNQPTSLTLPAVVKDPRPHISELAVKSLALTENYAALTQTLAQSQHEESLDAAIDGLRVWLPQDPKNGELLKNELNNVFHTETADAVYRLLWGYNKEDASSPSVSNQLVEWLGFDHLAVRKLAFFHIKRLTGREFDYRPLSPVAQRKAAVSRWKEYLAKEGTLLPGSEE